MDIHVLIIDDHMPIIEGYKTILSNNRLEANLVVSEALSAENAYHILTDSDNANKFDVIIVDYTIPAFEELQIQNGFDLLPFIRAKQTQAKIMILTSHSEALILYKVIMESRAEAIMIKSDFSSIEMLEAFENVYRGGKFYTKTVLKLKEELLHNYRIFDATNRELIKLLAKGYKTKNIMTELKLSKSAIDKRKAQIREFFEIEKGNDEDIIQLAKKKGYV
ncbi:response regulator [Flavobacterium stagni]|uniref:Response regulator transcription factor n=1 Tax=Flavobacterium stagni TaxID=2506421 RepID=A0A4Q1KBC8_9FLAO|nr:response regulator [Flavobacterium stagni]RXR24182.1 response regulator transcription factor [Flavobacterium stagni]